VVPSVFIVEAQALFGPELVRLVEAAGARVVGQAETLDLDEVIGAHPDVVLLDLDFTVYDVIEVLEVLRAEAPSIRTIVLTGERTRGWLNAARDAGAASVCSKATTEEELVHALAVIFDGGELWDARVEV
jgi:DNA-binding NarL/FixJ family response regulator